MDLDLTSRNCKGHPRSIMTPIVVDLTHKIYDNRNKPKNNKIEIDRNDSLLSNP